MCLPGPKMFSWTLLITVGQRDGHELGCMGWEDGNGLVMMSAAFARAGPWQRNCDRRTPSPPLCTPLLELPEIADMWRGSAPTTVHVAAGDRGGHQQGTASAGDQG